MRLVLQGGEVLDGTGAPAARADVVVSDGLVLDVGSGLDGDEALDCAGATITPGFVDAHVHVTSSGIDLMSRLTTPFSYQFFAAARNLTATLRAGVTTVRDAGGADVGVRKAVEDGLVAGPRMRIAVTILGQTGGHSDGWLPSGHCVPLSLPHPGRPEGVCDGVDGVRAKVREVLRAGADVVKICTTGGVLSPGDDPEHTQFSPEEIAVVVAEAAAQGREVMSHAQGATGVKNAVRAGVRSVEHGIFLDDEAIALMLEHDTALVPTLVAPRAVLEAAGAGARLPAEVVAKAAAVVDVHTDSIQRAVEAGVRIVMGTDSGVGPHGRNLSELPLMQACGMAPEAVVAASTSAGARLLGLGDVTGRVAPGLAADLCVVDGGLTGEGGLDDLSARLRAVYRDGRAVTG
ncbi:metal-dependent hydrolase family protein [Actinomycetospora termitidis]|uniref:Amidohydrolase family protein n=1 Tax=Actinomycetospora termitidis TaxID=3053470 RepID=A0ABT7M8J2_9PSEU|nr:amidohydrolase family protein [Actinomycetospora sp. Odt1-22]MDL5157000.1 amidohydrolase family protein [Actinomycetospora sp. Odt1-22]